MKKYIKLYDVWCVCMICLWYIKFCMFFSLSASTFWYFLGQNALPKHQLSLALVWDRADIAKSEIFSEDIKWKVNHLEAEEEEKRKGYSAASWKELVMQQGRRKRGSTDPPIIWGGLSSPQNPLATGHTDRQTNFLGKCQYTQLQRITLFYICCGDFGDPPHQRLDFVSKPLCNRVFTCHSL